MAFSSSSSSPSAEINVTPLIDVLLIIFMVIAPVLPHGLDSSVPQGRTSASTVSLPAVVHIIAGNAGTSPRYQIDARETTFAELRPALAQVFASRQDRTLFVQADRALSFGQVALVAGEARAAGAGTIAFIPQKR